MYKKSTLNEETSPLYVDFRVQRYNNFLIYAREMEIFYEKYATLCRNRQI